MWNKLLSLSLSVFIALPASAQPIIADLPLPPVSFTRVKDPDLLEKIGLDPVGGAWCYDDSANAILITAPARERSRCELRLIYEIEKLNVKHEFNVEKLKLRIETLQTQHEKINKIKDTEINRLTDAALKRPNDYSVWWATGGFLLGMVSTIAVVWSVER